MAWNKRKKATVAAGAALAGVCISAIALRCARKADLHLFRTKFGLASVYTAKAPDGRPVRLLRVGRSVQSATYLSEGDYAEPVFDYYHAFDLMFEANPRISNVLVLGGGGYAYPKHLIATRPNVHVDVVEIDPAINEIARKYFLSMPFSHGYRIGLPKSLNMICADGIEYLADLASLFRDSDRQTALQVQARYGNRCNRQYDAIVVDVFAAGRPVTSFARASAVRNARACLAPGGVLIANVVSTLEGPGAAFLNDYVSALESEFSHVRVIPLVDDASSPDSKVPDNVIVMARGVDWEFEG